MKKIYDKKEFIRLFERLNATKIINERIGYTAEPQNQNAFANTELKITSPVGDNVANKDSSTTDDFDPTKPTFAPVIPESSSPVIKREVRHLQVGDVLSGTGGKVVQAPVAGLKTPPGKMEVIIEYPNGRQIGKVWGKYTVVGIRPPSEVNGNPMAEDHEPIVQGLVLNPEDNVLEFKPKAGFWDVTKYVYGGHFDRFMGGEKGKLIPGTVKMGDEIRVKLEDGRTVVCSASAVTNMEFDNVLELAKSIGRQVV